MHDRLLHRPDRGLLPLRHPHGGLEPLAPPDGRRLGPDRAERRLDDYHPDRLPGRDERRREEDRTDRQRRREDVITVTRPALTAELRLRGTARRSRNEVSSL